MGGLEEIVICFLFRFSQDDPEAHLCYEIKGEQRGSKKGKLGRGDETGAERKGQGSTGAKRREGNRFRDPKPWVRSSRRSHILLKEEIPAEWLPLFLYFSPMPMPGYTPMPPPPTSYPQAACLNRSKVAPAQSGFLLGNFLCVLCLVLFLFLV